MLLAPQSQVTTSKGALVVTLPVGEQAGGQTEAAGGSQGSGTVSVETQTIDSGALKPVSFAVGAEKSMPKAQFGIESFPAESRRAGARQKTRNSSLEGAADSGFAARE